MSDKDAKEKIEIKSKKILSRREQIAILGLKQVRKRKLQYLERYLASKEVEFWPVDDMERRELLKRALDFHKECGFHEMTFDKLSDLRFWIDSLSHIKNHEVIYFTFLGIESNPLLAIRYKGLLENVERFVDVPDGGFILIDADSAATITIEFELNYQEDIFVRLEIGLWVDRIMEAPWSEFLKSS